MGLFLFRSSGLFPFPQCADDGQAYGQLRRTGFETRGRGRKLARPQRRLAHQNGNLHSAGSHEKAGYATAVFGKWGIGDFGSTGAPDKHGVDRFYGYTDQKACHTYYPPYLWNDGKKEVLNTSLTAATIGHGSQPKGEVLADTYRAEQHSSDLIADKMLEFVKEKAHGKQPFFLYYAPLEPHVAMQPLQEWIDRYPREWDKSPYRGNRGYLPHPRPRAAYAGMISQMDHNVGRLLDTLKACGLDKNTIVILPATTAPRMMQGGWTTGSSTP